MSTRTWPEFDNKYKISACFFFANRLHAQIIYIHGWKTEKIPMRSWFIYFEISTSTLHIIACVMNLYKMRFLQYVVIFLDLFGCCYDNEILYLFSVKLICIMQMVTEESRLIHFNHLKKLQLNIFLNLRRYIYSCIAYIWICGEIKNVIF